MIGRRANQSLRSQFTLLIVGIFLIPALAGFGIGLYNWLSSGEVHSSLSILFRVIQKVQNVDDLKEIRLSEKQDRTLSQRNGQLAVTNSEDEVVLFIGERFSSYEELISRTRVDNTDIFRVQVNRRDDTYNVILILDPSNPGPFQRWGPFFPGIVLLPLILTFLFVLLSSLGIIRGINGRIRDLEKATREISEGNLDYEVSDGGPDSFGSLAKSLDSMRHQLKEDEEARTRFMMSVSHDLKTPLSTIDGYLDALMESFGDDEATRQKFYLIMKEKSEILKERIARLIDFAKMSTGEWTEHLVPVRADEFFGDFISSYQVEAEMRNFKLTVFPLPDLDLSVLMDEHLAYRALENLVQNAMKYSDDRREVVIAAERDERELRFKVGNFGQGIRLENHEAVFASFFRESEGRNESGSGLGLSSVKHIVESHGWSIGLESEPGGYTEFVVHIPIKAV